MKPYETIGHEIGDLQLIQERFGFHEPWLQLERSGLRSSIIADLHCRFLAAGCFAQLGRADFFNVGAKFNRNATGLDILSVFVDQMMLRSSPHA